MAICTSAASHLIGIPLYLDPGSGSFLLQILLAALLGIAFAVKIYWKKIKALFTGKKEPAENIVAIESIKSPADASDEK
ncbi:MAG TPA: hypothetical protein VKF38_15835 [Anaerolineaceae bacterium]|nr:hypothetical protein [Anaerolineaceae bacterium]